MTSRRDSVVDFLHGLPAFIDARDRATAQATVDALAAAGLLRQTPAVSAVVKRVVRDDAGRITAIVERVEQLQGPDDAA